MIKHGHSSRTKKSPEYCSWQEMKSRCYYSGNAEFFRYGAKGVSVCDRWKYSFENFYEDMGERLEGMTLDRIDNDKGYSPENCRWADKTTQSRNTCKKSISSSNYKGVGFRKTRKDGGGLWRAFIKNNYKQLHLGWFTNELGAALAYDEKARELGYEEKWLNFPK